MARYQETSNPQYVRDTETGAFIPKDGTYLSLAFQSWVALGNTPDPVPEPSRDETVARNLATQASLLRNASDVIDPLQDASDMGIATDDERQSLSVWKVYRVMVNRVDTTSSEPAWPPLPRSSLEA